MDYRSSGTSRDVNASERGANDAYVCGLAMYERLEQPYLNLSNPRAALTGPVVNAALKALQASLRSPQTSLTKEALYDRGGPVSMKLTHCNAVKASNEGRGLRLTKPVTR